MDVKDKQAPAVADIETINVSGGGTFKNILPHNDNMHNNPHSLFMLNLPLSSVKNSFIIIAL